MEISRHNASVFASGSRQSPLRSSTQSFIVDDARPLVGGVPQQDESNMLVERVIEGELIDVYQTKRLAADKTTYRNNIANNLSNLQRRNTFGYDASNHDVIPLYGRAISNYRVNAQLGNIDARVIDKKIDLYA